LCENVSYGAPRRSYLQLPPLRVGCHFEGSFMLKRWFSAAILAAFSLHAIAADDTDKAVNEALQRIFPSTKPTQVLRSDLPGFHQAVIGSQVFFISDDGKYLIRGNVFDTVSRQDIGEKQLAAVRKGEIAKIPLSKQLVFAPSNPKYTVTVFTDVDCPYCREFHKQIAEYNNLGIAVNYVLFPLPMHKGADKKAEAVWCAGDRNTAYTDAMSGKDPGQKTCANPVAELTEIGKAIGVDGTPAIFSVDGEHIGGYLPPDKLVQRLDQMAEHGRQLSAK
jgi:thiol:disulfide interchange protein DsbC